MNKSFVIALAAGLAAVAALVGIFFWSNLGSQVRLEASIVKTRIIPTDENSAVAVLEMRINNPARVPFVIRTVTTRCYDATGGLLSSDQVAEMDLDRVLEYNKLAGPRFNAVLRTKARLPGGEQHDWTVGASFSSAAAKTLEGRRRFEVDLEDVDGVVVTVKER